MLTPYHSPSGASVNQSPLFLHSGPPGRVIERDEDATVGQRGALHLRAFVLRNGGQPLPNPHFDRDAQVRVRVTQLLERRPVERRRQPSGQSVVSDPQCRQARQVAEPARQAARETVSLKVHGRHAARRIDVHPVPLAERTVPKPPIGVRPASPARRFVQRPQHLRIGADRTLPVPVFKRLVPCEQVRAKAKTCIILESEHPQLQELQEAQRHGSRQLVGEEPQVFQVGQPAQFRRDGARQLVGEEPQVFQVGQPAQFRRDGAGQLVVPEKQDFQVGQPAQFRRDGA